MNYAIGVFTTLAILLFITHYHQVQYRRFRLRMAAITGRMLDEAKDWQTIATEQIRQRLAVRGVSWSNFVLVMTTLFLGGGLFAFSITHSIAISVALGGLLCMALPLRKLRKMEKTQEYAHCVSLFQDVIPKGEAAMDLDGKLETAIREIAEHGESPTGRRIMGRVNQWHRAGIGTSGEYFLQVAEEEGNAEWRALAAISAAVESRHPNMSKIWKEAGRMMQDEWEAREEFHDYFRGFRSASNIVYLVILGVTFTVQALVHLLGGHGGETLATLTLFCATVLYLAARYVLDQSLVED